MANQAIALGVRAPQSVGLGGVIQQNAQVMNMMMQQQAAQRAAEKSQREAELAQTRMGLETRKEDQAFQAAQIKMLRDKLPAVAEMQSDGAWVNWLGELDAVDPKLAQDLYKATGGKFNADVVDHVSMVADTYLNKKYATPTVTPVQDASGNYWFAHGGGLGGEFVTPAKVGGGASTPPAPTGKKISAPVTPTGGAAAVRSRGDNTAPADLLQQGVNPASIPLGNPLAKPISYEGPTGVQALTPETAPQIIEAAKQNGSIDQAHLMQLRDMIGPENDQALASWMQQNNVKIAEAKAPTQLGQLFADQSVDGLPVTPRRGIEGAVDVVNEPGTQFRGKSPTVSPTPSPPPPTVTYQQSGAQKGGEARAARLEKLRGDMPKAFAEAQAIQDDLRSRIEEIDRFLRNPERGSAIGAIEGKLPDWSRWGAPADAVASWNTIVNSKVLQSILDSRKATETGGSPLGPLSNRDLELMIGSATSLTRSGEQKAQEVKMQRMRDMMYRSLRRNERLYGDQYREVMEPRFQLTPADVPEKYSPTPQKRATPTKKGGVTLTPGGSDRESQIQQILKKHGG